MRAKLGIALLVSIVIASAAVLAFGTGRASSAEGCRFVSGRIINEHPEAGLGVARIVGTFNGRYEFTFTGILPDPSQPNVKFSTGEVRIQTKHGDLFWHESSANDVVNEDDFSTATLATISGGTGDWAGAQGHVDLSGAFHVSTFTGNFDYRGVVCRARSGDGEGHGDGNH
jgi:hypothetical protein